MKSNEIIIEAEYTDIVISLLNKPYYITSITKLLFISFCIYHEQGSNRKYINRTTDVADIFLKDISIKLSNSYQDIKYILHVIDILNRTGRIEINGDNIEVKNIPDFSSENSFLVFCSKQKNNPIIEVSKLDPKGLIEEVIRYV